MNLTPLPGCDPVELGQEHLQLLTDSDRTILERAYRPSIPDPGRRTLAAIHAMTPDELLVYDERRKRWMEAMPPIPIRPAATAFAKLKAHCASSGGLDDAQLDVLAVYGEPGVGKSKLAIQLAAYEIERRARIDYLLGEGNARPDERRVARPITQRVGYFEFKGAMSRIDFERELCHDIGQHVKRGDWASSLTAGLKTTGMGLLLLDEIQFINFGGATGRQVHHSIKNITNAGTNVVVFGNDIQWVIGTRNEAEGELSRRQARGRWITMEIPKLERTVDAEYDDWQDLLFAFEQRLRLGDPGAPGWLSTDLADYVWARTNGYFNALAALMKRSASVVYGNTERITRDVLERVDLHDIVESGRNNRVSLLGGSPP